MSWNDWKTKPTLSPRSRARCVFVERAELLAVEVHGAGGRPVESGQEAEQRGLAAARGPDDGDEPPGSTVKLISFSTVSRRPPER